jgi:hypothetical protein
MPQVLLTLQQKRVKCKEYDHIIVVFFQSMLKCISQEVHRIPETTYNTGFLLFSQDKPASIPNGHTWVNYLQNMTAQRNSHFMKTFQKEVKGIEISFKEIQEQSSLLIER